MTDMRNSRRVAINVMRARLTVVAFNLAIVTVQLNLLPKLPGAIELPHSRLLVHLGTDISLLLGLALSVVALVVFIVSSAYDEQGTCDHGLLVVGDLFMYLGLAQSVSGFFMPIAGVLGQEAAGAEFLHGALVAAGGLAWFMASYAGPVVSLLRSPRKRYSRAGMATLFVLLSLLVALINADARQLGMVRASGDATATVSVWGELVQPFRW